MNKPSRPSRNSFSEAGSPTGSTVQNNSFSDDGIAPSNSSPESFSAASLMAAVAAQAAGTKIIVVSNREPVIHEHSPHGIRAIRPASGLVTALEPIVRAVHGTWIAHGSGSADRRVVDRFGRIGIPENSPEYALRRVWLTRQEEEGYYYGLSNTALWPLCHIAYTRPSFSRQDWAHYVAVNAKFCDAVLQEAGSDEAVVFVQDYHLALLPRLLKNARPDLTIVQFWHIPWPNREAFRIFPWGEELLDGLLGNDVLGFHVQHHCNNFLDTVDRGIEAKVDYEHFRVFRGGHPTFVRAFPIGVDYAQINIDAQSRVVLDRQQELRVEFSLSDPEHKVLVSVDRIDYTKGIEERLRAFDFLLRDHPELQGSVTYLNFCAPSRTHVPAYHDLNDRIDSLVDEINWRYQTEAWVPVRFLRAHHDYTTVLAAYTMADVLAVTSLHDGMNLVAKEFVAARTDESGVLILSPYTGAAREFSDALLINPYDTDLLADSLWRALHISREEQRQRMQRLREQVRIRNIFDWGRRVFTRVQRLTGGVNV